MSELAGRIVLAHEDRVLLEDELGRRRLFIVSNKSGLGLGQLTGLILDQAQRRMGEGRD